MFYGLSGSETLVLIVISLLIFIVCVALIVFVIKRLQYNLRNKQMSSAATTATTNMTDTSQRAYGGQRSNANDESHHTAFMNNLPSLVPSQTPSHHRPPNILIIAQAEDDHPPIYTPPPAYDIACLDM